MTLKAVRLFVIGGLALAGLTSLLPAQAVQNTEVPERTSYSSLQKSLLLPGWGQFSEKRYFEGSFFLTLEICYLLEVLKNNKKGNEAYKLYKAAGSEDEAIRYRELTEHHDKARNYHMLLAAGVWAVNLFDTYVIVKRKGKNKGKVSVGADVSKNQGISLHLCFSF